MQYFATLAAPLTFALALCCHEAACAQIVEVNPTPGRLPGDSMRVCQRLASDMELPLQGSAAFYFACERQAGVMLDSVHVGGDRLSSDDKNLTSAARMVANDSALWPLIIRAENIKDLAVRLGETDVLKEDSRNATRTAIGKCSNAQCIGSFYEQQYQSRISFIKTRAASFPREVAIDSEMPCANPSKSRRVVISLTRNDTQVRGATSGIECSTEERVEIKGTVVDNVATMAYMTAEGKSRELVVVLFGDNLYLQALDLTPGLQEGSYDGLIIRLAQHSELMTADQSPQCSEGPSHPQPPEFSSLRPDRTAECPYSFDELVARITRLSINTALPYSVETVEKAFSIPPMTTSNDSARQSSYMMTLSGKGGWRLALWVRESFFPLDKGPAAFEPGLRPKRLRKLEEADLRVDLDLLSPVGSDAGPCVPVSAFLHAILAAGWQDIQGQYLPPTDGGTPTPIFGQGAKRVSILGNRGSCANNVTLMESARSPEPGSSASRSSEAGNPGTSQPPPLHFQPLPTAPPPGDLKYIVTDLDIFDDASANADYLSRLQEQMHRIECCATDVTKLFSGYRLQVRGYQLSTFLPSADQDVIKNVLSEESPPVRAANKRREAVGTVPQRDSDTTHGYLLRDGRLTDLGTLGGRTSEANAINNCGQVVGASGLMFGGGEDVFVYQSGVMKDLGPGHANAISDRGLVAGEGRFDGLNQRAALWVRGKPIELCDALSEAFAINNAGAVVGECDAPEDEDQPHAFLYQKGTRIDLRDYIVHPRRPGVRDTNTVGASINDAGQIIIYEYEIPRPNPSDEIAYLLTPVTSESLDKALQSISSQDRDLWLGRCNRLFDLRHIANEDRQPFLRWCTESAALPYLKEHRSETTSARTSCVSLNAIVPANVEDAEVPYRVRIPVSPERFIAELAKLAAVSEPREAVHRLHQGLRASWRKEKEADQVWWTLAADDRWHAALRLSSDPPHDSWVLAAGDRFGHDQLVFRESGTYQCLRIDLVDHVLEARGFERTDTEMPLIGPFIRWELHHSGTVFSIEGEPTDNCLPALLVRYADHARPNSP